MEGWKEGKMYAKQWDAWEGHEACRSCKLWELHESFQLKTHKLKKAKFKWAF